MFVRCLLLALFWGGVARPLAWAQSQRGPAYFLRHPGGARCAGLPFAADTVPASARVLPGTWAAAATLPLPARLLPVAPTSLAARPVAEALPAASRHDATGVRPLYDLYRDLPEDFRKHTLPAVYTEPLPVQLLRGVLGR